MTWCIFRLKVGIFVPIRSMYGIFHYIWLLFFNGKCIGTYNYHTWMLWVYGKKTHVTLILLSPSPNVSWVLGGGMAGWWFQILSMLNRSL